VVLRVADSGCGIPQDHLDRVRDPFFTTKPSSQGTGLGLTLCSQVVGDLGGQIDITSQMGSGTCVTVILPRASAEPLATPTEDTSTMEAALEGAKILLVDDEERLLRALRRELRGRNRVATALGGAEAIRTLERDAEFDLVVCDLMMPDVDGPVVFSILQQRWPALARRVAFTTGGAFTERGRDFLNSVDAPVLTKPVSIQQLALAYRRISDRECTGTGHGDVQRTDCVERSR
jgi:CheY-like chemotaxis protein